MTLVEKKWEKVKSIVVPAYNRISGIRKILRWSRLNMCQGDDPFYSRNGLFMQMYCLNKMRILIGSDCRMDRAEPSKLRQYIIICSPTPWKRGKWASARSLRQKKRADLTIIHLFRVICFVTQYKSMQYIQMLLLQTYKKDSVFFNQHN